MIDLKNLTIKKAHEHLRTKDFSAVELTEAYLAEIGRKDPELHAYLEVFGDATKQAEASQKLIDAGEGGELAGIPFAIKDNILIKGRIASAASKMLEKYTASYDATVIAKLKREGAVFLGRANMDEFAMGSSTENSAFGVTKNPHDPTRVAGGTSGGSVAAVAANMALVALGSDTGGSIRQPAALCGVVGLKTTYGRVSRYGAIAMGSSLDQIGSIGKTVSDAEIVYHAIKGLDKMDSTTISDTTYPSKALGGTFVAGIPKGLMDMGGIDEDVKENFEQSVKKLEGLGATIREVDLPYLKYSLPTYYIIMPAEVSSNLSRFDGVKYGLHTDGANMIDDYFETRAAGFGPETRRRILLGTYVLSSGYYDAYYNKAVAVRNQIRRDFEKAYESVDVIITPTVASPAFKIGEKVNDPISMYLEDIFTVTANIAGIPAISVPSGNVVRDGKSLPLGFQIMAAHGREQALFSIGKKFLGEAE